MYIATLLRLVSNREMGRVGLLLVLLDERKVAKPHLVELITCIVPL